jgi:hypothetical protein
MKKIKLYLILTFAFSSILYPLKAASYTFVTHEEADYITKEWYSSKILEVYAYLTELFSTYTMGNPSTSSIVMASLINITSSLGNVVFDIGPIVRQLHKKKIYPHNTFDTFQETYYLPLPFLIDSYFLAWDVKKLYHAQNLASFYEKNEHMRYRLQEKKRSLLKQLFLSAALRMCAFYIRHKEREYGFNKDTSALLSACATISLFIGDVADVMRKYERRSNEFHHFFEWMKRADYEWVPEEQG